MLKLAIQKITSFNEVKNRKGMKLMDTQIKKPYQTPKLEQHTEYMTLTGQIGSFPVTLSGSIPEKGD